MRPILICAGLLVGCHGTAEPSSSTHTRWLVIAPHPDDEALVAGGLLARATAAGDPVAVVVMTNGDYDCIHDGLLREGESVTGLAAVGVSEENIHFLGYPDGGLARLGVEPLPSKRLEGGRCVVGTTTYGARGHGRRDVHGTRFGRAASYTHEDAVADLVTLLREFRPDEVVVTHPSDTHPDHAATYALLRSALDRLPVAPRVHRAIVHNGDCWPTGTAPHEPCPGARVSVDEPTPPLSGRLRGYAPNERLAVPPSCRTPDRGANAKLRDIAAHASQTRRDPASYLFSFARQDEAFFAETFEREGAVWRRAKGTARRTYTAVLRREMSAFDAGAYRLEVDVSRQQATLRRAGAPEALQVWPLPHDLFARSPRESFSLDVDPRADDGVVELSLRARDGWIGVAVDVGRL